ncbi:MAG: hypothetical protein KDB10_05150, partial [Acidimicrobiales bacterium]|nr:hypothetical protein [Acidimicrobiales bacterium]
RGVCGLLDMEDMGADLLWLRGHDRDVRLPTWELSVEEIERSAGPWAPPQASFAVEQLVAGAKAARRRTGGELGRNHWLVALARGGHTVPEPAGGTDPEAAARRLQAQLDLGTLGAPLPEDVVREQAAASARRAGRALVTVEDLVAAVAE